MVRIAATSGISSNHALDQRDAVRNARKFEKDMGITNISKTGVFRIVGFNLAGGSTFVVDEKFKDFSQTSFTSLVDAIKVADDHTKLVVKDAAGTTVFLPVEECMVKGLELFPERLRHALASARKRLPKEFKKLAIHVRVKALTLQMLRKSMRG